MEFRELTPTEEKKFRAWAHANYQPHAAINELWHPCVQDECRVINAATDPTATVLAYKGYLLTRGLLGEWFVSKGGVHIHCARSLDLAKTAVDGLDS